MSNPKSKRTQKNPQKRNNPPPKKSKKNQSAASARKPQVAAAAAYATGQSHSGPRIQNGRDSCRIVHRELVDNVNSSTNFATSIFAIQPGAPQTFRWLSIMAQCWEKYKFNMLRFRYVTRTGTGTSGSVAMAFDYDANDSAPESEQIMSTYHGIQEDVPWKDNVCTALPSRLNDSVREHYIRTGTIGASQDLKFYDAANFILAVTNGVDNTASWGKLWVEYDVTLSIPQLPASGSVVNGGSGIGSAAGAAPGLPYGSLPTNDTQNNQVALVVTTAGTVNQLRFFSAGTYLLTTSFAGTGLTAVSVGGAFNCTVSAATWIPTSTGGAILGFAVIIVPEIVGPGSDFASVNISVAGTTVTGAAYRVGQAPGGSQDLV